MKLNLLSRHHAEITLADGTQVLFSYTSPVACLVEGEYSKTAKIWSQTTSRHINSWAPLAIEKPQEYFDNLVHDI